MNKRTPNPSMGCHEHQGLGFRVWGLGFRVWGLGFRVWGFGVWGLGFRAYIGCRV